MKQFSFTLLPWFFKRRYSTELPAESLLSTINGSQLTTTSQLTKKLRNRPGYWKSKHNQRRFLDEVSKKIGIKDWQDWYNITVNEISSNGGQGLLFIYRNSIKKMLSTIYPEHPWDFLKFHIVEKNAYQSISVQRQVFDRLAEKLQIKNWADWYSISGVHIRERNERSVFALYNCSLYKALKTIYPEHPWRIMDFRRVTEGFWNDFETQKLFLDELEEKLSIQNPKDWIRIKTTDFVNLGGASLLKLYDNSFKKLLSAIYDDINWDEVARVGTQTISFEGGKRQRHLFDILCSIFPTVGDVLMNHIISKSSIDSVAVSRNEISPNFQIGNSVEHKIALEAYGDSQRVELDICIPSVKLAFEYQSEIHELNDEIQDRDKMKRKLCKELNFTLIEIPYWWDGTKDSIIATIHQYRPDLVKEKGTGNPINPIFALKSCDGKIK